MAFAFSISCILCLSYDSRMASMSCCRLTFLSAWDLPSTMPLSTAGARSGGVLGVKSETGRGRVKHSWNQRRRHDPCQNLSRCFENTWNQWHLSSLCTALGILLCERAPILGHFIFMLELLIVHFCGDLGNDLLDSALLVSSNLVLFFAWLGLLPLVGLFLLWEKVNATYPLHDVPGGPCCPLLPRKNVALWESSMLWDLQRS